MAHLITRQINGDTFQEPDKKGKNNAKILPGVVYTL